MTPQQSAPMRRWTRSAGVREILEVEVVEPVDRQILATLKLRSERLELVRKLQTSTQYVMLNDAGAWMGIPEKWPLYSSGYEQQAVQRHPE